MYQKGYFTADNFAYSGAEAGQCVGEGKTFSYAEDTNYASAEGATKNLISKTGDQNILYKHAAPMAEAKYYHDSYGFAGTFISKNNKNPEASIKFIQFMFSKEGQYLSVWGREGIDWTMGSNGLPVFGEEWQKVFKGDPDAKNFNGAFYFGISAVSEAEGRSIDMSEHTRGIQKLVIDKTLFIPQMKLSEPITGTDEKIIMDKIVKLIEDYEAQIILSGSEEELVKKYDELIKNAEDIGIRKVEEYMTRKMKDLSF